MSSFDYQKSTITKYRAGTSADPYVDITETKKVINGQIQLNEIPVLLNKVKVNGMFEASNSDKSDLVQNVYRVDYVEGMLYFHPTAEGLTLTYNYKGRGNHFISSARIWTKEQDGNVTQTLEDLVEGASNFYYADDYTANSNYKTYNIVNYLGSSYIAIKDTSGNPPTNSIYWRKLSGGSYRGIYSDTTIYNSGDTVADYDNHNIYRSLVSSSSGNSLLDSSKWELTISVQSTITAAELATQDAIDSSEEAITQANYAKDQGDFALDKGIYANQQGQYVDDLVTSFVYFGEYQNGTHYKVNNQVSMNGTTYICIQDSLSNDPQSSPLYWKVFASGGYTATVKYANEVILSSEISVASIGIPLFSQETDILLVYQNSTYITQGTDFTVSVDNTKIEKVSGTWSNGTTFNFIVIKSVPAGNDSFDGALLAPETVTNVKLSSDIKIGSLANLTTIEKSSVVGAINELDVNIDSVTTQMAEHVNHNGKRYKIKNPYADGGSLHLKGQLHCHTTNSDGIDSPVALVNAYKNSGYDFITITDHNFITPNPNVSGITWLGSGVEETYLYHVVAYDISEQAGEALELQETIDFHSLRGKMTNIAHPNWTGVYTMDKFTLGGATNYNFLEVYNSVVDAYGEDQWDYALSAGKRTFGLATDDCHDSTSVEFNRGWVVVHTKSNDKSSIINALMTGNFFASTGNDVSIELEGNVLTASSTSASNFDFISDNGRVIKSVASSTSTSYTITGDERYVRVRAKKVSDNTLAWSNPVFVEIVDTDDVVITRYTDLVADYAQSIINGDFRNWRKGEVFSNPADMLMAADGWMIRNYNPDGTHPSTLTAIKGYMIDNFIAPREFFRFAVGSSNTIGTSAFYGLQQYIENGARNLCGKGKSVTVSFYARSTLTGKKIGIMLRQSYGREGTGYSPVENISGETVLLSNNWKRYSVTFKTNDTSNKTFGEGYDDFLRVTFATAWSTNFKDWFNADGSENFSEAMEIHITGIQLDEGTEARPYAKQDRQRDIDRSKKYTVVKGERSSIGAIIAGGNAVSASSVYATIDLNAIMRRVPSLLADPADWALFDGVTSHDISAISILTERSSPQTVTLNCSTLTSLTPFRYYYLISKSADKRLIFDAELREL